MATSNITLSTSSVTSWLDSILLFVSSFLATSGVFTDSSLSTDLLTLFLLVISSLTTSSLVASFLAVSLLTASSLVASFSVVSLLTVSLLITSFLAVFLLSFSLLITSSAVSYEVGCSVTTGLLLACCIFWLLFTEIFFSCLTSILLVLVSSVTSAAWATLPIPKKIDAATATDAAPTVNFFIE